MHVVSKGLDARRKSYRVVCEPTLRVKHVKKYVYEATRKATGVPRATLLSFTAALKCNWIRQHQLHFMNDINNGKWCCRTPSRSFCI